MSASAAPFPQAVYASLKQAEGVLNNNAEFRAATRDFSFSFSLSAGEEAIIVADIANQQATLGVSPPKETLFCLSARPDDWSRMFLSTTPQPPYHSYWGLVRTFGHEAGVGASGDITAYCQYALVWRLVLEAIRDAATEQPTESTPSTTQSDDKEDALVGRYVNLITAGWGRARIFYEQSGTGPQQILFLHTAGADSRQYHALMNMPELRRRCTMTAFDLPGHGRSSPGALQPLRGYTNDETRYVETIRLVIHDLNLKDVVVCGASMAGHVCLALAIAASHATMAKSYGICGVIPCEAATHLPDRRPAHEKAPSQLLNESLATPERVCGMVAPQSPAANRDLIWWTYSAQATGVFRGDLEFYFGGWDGRGRVETIDTSICPVYMLTGEYDYSCTPAVSEATAKSIPGAKFELMEGLGHFPASENPERFLPYFLKALDHIQSQREK